MPVVDQLVSLCGKPKFTIVWSDSDIDVVGLSIIVLDS